ALRGAGLPPALERAAAGLALLWLGRGHPAALLPGHQGGGGALHAELESGRRVRGGPEDGAGRGRALSPAALNGSTASPARPRGARGSSTSAWNVSPLMSQRLPPSWPRPMRPQLAMPGRLGVGG